MTYQPPQQGPTPYYPPTPPPVQPGPPWAPAPTPPAKSGRGRTALLLVLGAFALVLIVVLAAGLLSGSDDKQTGSGTAATKATTQAMAAPVATTDDPTPPKVSDFTLTPKIVEKNCYGSAGCSITLRVEVTMEVLPDSDASWLVVYEIRGVEDGPEVGNLTITGDRIEGTEENVSTSSSKSKITIKVTSIEPA